MKGNRGTVLVTGGSRGIGASIAERLAQDGYDIWLNYRSNHEEAKKVKQRIESAGGRCELLPFDVSDPDAVDNSLDPLLEEITPYALVHNAGITRDALAAMMGLDDWRLVIETDLTSFFLLAKKLLRPMLSKRQGRIVAISSVSGETGQAGQMNYSAAKAGIIGAAKALAREVAKRNILVNVVAPGFIETDMTKGLPMERYLPAIPMARVGQPEEVSGVVSFLLGDDASYITGQVIGVNGGLYM